MIFGYKKLAINLFYLHNSAKCYVDIKASEKIVETELYKADDIMKSLNPWLPENFTTNKSEFLEELKHEDHTVLFGDVLETFPGDGDSNNPFECLPKLKKSVFSNLQNNTL